MSVLLAITLVNLAVVLALVIIVPTRSRAAGGAVGREGPGTRLQSRGGGEVNFYRTGPNTLRCDEELFVEVIE